MAKAYPSGATGTVTLPTGHGADIASQTIDETQDSESVAFFGTNTYNPFRGSGTFEFKVTCTAFAAYSAAGTAPGFGSETSTGSSATFGVSSTTVQFVGAMVVQRIQLVQSRLRAAVPLTFEMHNSADTMVTTWPVT